VHAYRTPDDRFDNLPEYPFAPNYFEWESLRMHYLDEGRPHGAPMLLLHGEPDWSYLYRRMVPVLGRRFRVVAPDYLGFGRSDKPTDIGWYSYDRHTARSRHWSTTWIFVGPQWWSRTGEARSVCAPLSR
jgi:haloalkane dehalogenase